MSGITNITIPENISIIESSAFALCKNLTNVTTCSRRYLNTANAFENCDKLTDIFVSP
ncbi:hypothetical protein TVAG_103510 [Trichomonas vaginalis G3]|uniref:Surface antigen BspA-like n=1 Tax=Trichomonas vaginalis (strain ATCC PRA-98 / G3) TaxID=412133 RepID=A2EKR2_TRIV3|nr:ribonuclease inhibitor domain-containing protein [Trichomonas vaginalis G3]EAY06801.1 hypothetical protein TVAG_103510 [Trichomonas vaginalis G3]KAI5485839.1 ribonuclease inhibitor domain-containing protein [Trichomonas vaginalis G3]|eukprot:XP_001319024.1 hypothetical protein [Trichomonas vaginalis G3]